MYTRNPNYPFDDSKVVNRQVTPAKRSMSLAKLAAMQGVVAFVIQQLASPWNNYGKLYVLRVPATGVEVPAIDSVLHFRNRQTGIPLGIWRVLDIAPADPAYGTPFPVWDLHATADHRAERNGNGNTPQATLQSPVTAVPATPALTVETVGRPSTRERVSHFSTNGNGETVPATEPVPEPVPATAAAKPRPPARAGRR